MRVIDDVLVHRNPYRNHRPESVLVTFSASAFDGVSAVRCVRLEL